MSRSKKVFADAPNIHTKDEDDGAGSSEESDNSKEEEDGVDTSGECDQPVKLIEGKDRQEEVGKEKENEPENEPEKEPEKEPENEPEVRQDAKAEKTSDAEHQVSELRSPIKLIINKVLQSVRTVGPKKIFMTETPGYPKVVYEVALQIGHCCFKKALPRQGLTHEWNIFLRGARGFDISPLIEKVVFVLDSTFKNPERVVKRSPYVVNEYGHSSFYLPVKVFFKERSLKPRNVEFVYNLYLVNDPNYSFITREKLQFINPDEDFIETLIKAGGVLWEKKVFPDVSSGTESASLFPVEVAYTNGSFAAEVKSRLDSRTKAERAILQQKILEILG